MRSRSRSRRPIHVLCALLVVGGLTQATAAAQATATAHSAHSAHSVHSAQSERTSWAVDLSGTSADQRNIAHRGGGITVGSLRESTASADGRPYAVYTAPRQSLGRQAAVFSLRPQARVPAGTRLLTELRGSSHPGHWTQWSTPDRAGWVQLPKAVSVVQVRVTLFGSTRGTAPSVEKLTLRAAPGRPEPRGRAASQATDVTFRVYATREGLVGETTANGHVIQARDHFVALPSRKMLASNGGREYQVRICNPANGRCETAPVWDVGPWNTKDDYWNPSAERDTWRDLPQGRPQAQAAYQDGYNGGKDERGRQVKNPAGIDIADGTFWDGLGMTGNGWVDVTFQPGDGGGGDGGTATVTAWTQARVRSCAWTSCGVVSTVYANESYPADCWTTGEPVTDAGYTNDKWVRLPLRAGGAGYVSAVYLKGDETGNVSRRC